MSNTDCFCFSWDARTILWLWQVLTQESSQQVLRYLVEMWRCNINSEDNYRKCKITNVNWIMNTIYFCIQIVILYTEYCNLWWIIAVTLLIIFEYEKKIRYRCLIYKTLYMYHTLSYVSSHIRWRVMMLFYLLSCLVV